MHGCLNDPSLLLGRCWIAQVCRAGRLGTAARAAVPWGLELPGRYLEPPLETQPAGPPLDFHPRVLTRTCMGGKMEAVRVQMFVPCSFDSLCL